MSHDGIPMSHNSILFLFPYAEYLPEAATVATTPARRAGRRGMTVPYQ